ncbi:MAG TPA: type II CAAX endopeptidase family protein [Thermoplasmata archaeon]|nr:type II CAAX endopeptidase family protein [Thermoplasmata archaeon]
MIAPAVPGSTDVATGSRPRVGPYAVAVVATVLAVVSQYWLPETVPATRVVYGSLVGSLAVVYGLPILAFLLLVGVEPLRPFARSMGRASWEGLRWYGLLSVVALFVSVALVLVYEAVDPAALDLLTRPNPVVESARAGPGFWIAFSFAVGALEETIFRGWLFGFWRGRPGLPWIVPAVGSSALFAGVHLYYGFTYGIASPIVYPDLFFLGLAFAAAVHYSGGNLVVVALLHGANDAASFLSLVSTPASLAVHWGIVGVGALIAVVDYAGIRPFRSPGPFAGTLAPTPPPPPYGPGPPPS